MSSAKEPAGTSILTAAAAAAIATAIQELPELVAIIRRGLAGADSNDPLVPQLDEILPPVEETEIGQVVAKLRAKKLGD